MIQCVRTYFNSRAHVERDVRRNDAKTRSRHFNSRAHVERDFVLSSVTRPVSISTHALTWSATVTILLVSVMETNFNSRAHVERDYPISDKARKTFDFNSRAHVERDK